MPKLVCSLEFIMTKAINTLTQLFYLVRILKRLGIMGALCFFITTQMVSAATNPIPKALMQSLPISSLAPSQRAVKKTQNPVIPLLDPTKPPAFLLQQSPTSTAIAWEKSGIVLTAIYHYPRRTFAIINGNPTGIGATVNGFKITKITHDAVWFQGADGDSHVLRLFLPVRN